MALVLLAHALMLLPFLLARPLVRQVEPVLQFVGLWIEPPRVQSPDPVEPDPVRTPRPAQRALPLPDTPSTAITPDSPEGAAPAPSPPRAIDWHAAGAEVARRAAAAPSASAGFSPAPPTIPEPCVPREMDEETRKLMAQRMPSADDPLPVGPDPTANCIRVGGRPMCVQKMSVPLGSLEANGHLFDDVRRGDQNSSVPSPRLCD